MNAFVKIGLMAFLVGSCLFNISAQNIQWLSLEEAQALNQKEPRKIMVDVYTHWCGPCKMMMKQTFGNAWIADYVNKNYYAVKFNAEGPDPVKFKGKLFENPGYVQGRPGRNATHQLTHAIAPVNGRIAYPTVVFIDQDLNLIAPVQGFQRPVQFEPMLKFIAEEKYKTVSWQDYMKSFKGELK